MKSPRIPDLDDDPDPALGAVAAAILDGAGIDWDAASVSHSIAAFESELRLVAGIAALHRSLTDADAEALPLPHPLPWRIGTQVITESLGRGTYGEVFRAWDDQLHRDVAIKLLFAGERRGDVSARALDEGRLLARVRHPNVITVHAVERIDGRVGLVTEYVDGQTLAQIVRQAGPLDPAQAARIGIDLCRALDAVHEAGLLHRDIKPQNVMREGTGRVVLMDFGASFAGEPEAALAGTPLYLAPEVLAGGAATQRSDIYSAGVLLHYLVTGAYPVSGASLADVREAHAKGRRVPLAGGATAIPRALAAAIDTATDPDPVRRHGTAAAFADALQAAIAPARRRPSRILAAVSALALVAVAAGVLWVRRTPVPEADTASEVAARVTVPPYYTFGGPSFDGRYMVHVDPKHQVWVTQIETGHVRRILEGEPGKVHWIVLSPDGTSAAYTSIHPDGRVELRIANIEDRWPGTVWQAQTFPLITASAPTYIVPMDWSRDSTKLAVMSHRKEGPVDLIVAAPTGTERRVVHTFTGPRPRRVSFSGDGRFITYDRPNWPSPQRDIYIVPADGSTEPVLLLGDPSNDELPVWSADGEHLLFQSDRDGSSGLWRVPVANGAVAGRPTLIATGTQAVTPIAVTASGDYHYALQTKHEQLLTVHLDERGVASGAPVAVSGGVGLSRTSPAWSPDGRTLAHLTTRGMNLYDFGSFLTLRDREGRLLRDVGLPLIYFGGGIVRWSPDGQSLLVRGKGLDGHWGFHRVDTRTGEFSAMVRAEPQGEEQNLGTSPGWGHDGRTIVWTRFGEGILERTLATGRNRVLLSVARPDAITSVSAVHRGLLVAFSKTISLSGNPRSVIAVLHDNGSVTELVTKPGGRSLLLAEWVAGDDAIIYAEAAGNGNWRLWRLRLDGGAPVDMNVTTEPGRLRISHRSDGRALTYATGATAFEIWVMRGIAR